MMHIKTLLKINDDLKEYLKEERDKSDKSPTKEYVKHFGCEPFDWQWIFEFENGYGASVIKSPYSFGSDADLFELATLKYNGDTHVLSRIYQLDEDSGIFGYLTNEDVMDLLYKIKNI